MSKKKTSTAATTLKKVSTERAITQTVETLRSIETSHTAGQLASGPDVHPIMRVYDEQSSARPLSDADIASLLVHRLRMQGYVIYFDAKVAKASFDEGMARLKQILPD